MLKKSKSVLTYELFTILVIIFLLMGGCSFIKIAIRDWKEGRVKDVPAAPTPIPTALPDSASNIIDAGFIVV